MPNPSGKRLPLPKRVSVAMTERAYARLRDLNARHGFGNNYLLTILLENLDDIADAEAIDRIMDRFAAEYGAPGDRMDHGRGTGA